MATKFPSSESALVVADGIQLVLPQVVSAVVPQCEVYDVVPEYLGDTGTRVRHFGHIGFCSQAPNIEGVCGAAKAFTGADSYERACAYVVEQREIYQAMLADFLLRS